mgnify:CR=1 FL=1
MGALAFVLPVQAAFVSHGVLQLVANGWRGVLHRRHVRWDIVAWYALASLIAVVPAVRAALLQRQQDFRTAPGLIADGRDMGTIVFPDAVLKIFMDASPEERAQRRLKQLSAKGIQATLAPLCEEIRARDERDRNRPIAPLRPADESEVVDTTGLSPQDVLSKVEALLQRHRLV